MVRLDALRPFPDGPNSQACPKVLVHAQARKSSKGKDKKQARKAVNAVLVKHQQEVKDLLLRASQVSDVPAAPRPLTQCRSQSRQRVPSVVCMWWQVEDLLEGYVAFQRYARNGLDLALRFYWAEKLPEGVQVLSYSHTTQLLPPSLQAPPVDC